MSTTQERTSQAADTGAAQETIAHDERRPLRSYLFMPVVLAVALLALYLWISSQDLGSRESERLNASSIISSTQEHIVITLVSTALVLVIAIPLGVMLTRAGLSKIITPAIAVFNVGQALPTIGLLALAALVWDIGFWPVVVSLVVYTVLPVLRNTMVGLQQVDPAVVEAARGMGMTPRAVLFRIELPLAVPIMMAGARTALVINVGTAALGAFVGVGTLGSIIIAGTQASLDRVVIVGAALTAVLALLVDYLAGIAEDLLRPRGL
ncbi:MAG TPA: ABC transporter permease [Jiangellaceae bacterium]|nr:ABC transporter permease [Jiangellaceae bacterium]